MKYTRSKDGIERVTLVAKKRVTRTERRDLIALARRRGQTLQEFLFCALEDGICREWELDEGERESEDGQ
jgi:hypothetical protein